MSAPSRVLTMCVVLHVWAVPAFAWGDMGHRIVARIAARKLTTATRQRIVRILRDSPVNDLQLKQIVGVNGDPQPSPAALERAMAAMAVWPDHMPGGKGVTGPWHYVDIGLFEGPSHLHERCGSACVTERITTILANLASGQKIQVIQPSGQKLLFGADGQLRFLLHFMGDIHQPLHAVTNADAGGNCETVTGFPFSNKLHSVWDTALVLKAIDGLKDPAGAILAQFQSEHDTLAGETDPEAIAAESFELAKTRVYPNTKPKPVPVIGFFVHLTPSECSTKAPAAIRAITVNGPASFSNAASLRLVRRQLFKAGVRLAAMLKAAFP